MGNGLTFALSPSAVQDESELILFLRADCREAVYSFGPRQD